MSHSTGFYLAILYFLGGICCLIIYWSSQRNKPKHLFASIEGLVMEILFWPFFIILDSWQRRVDTRNEARKTLRAQQNGCTEPGNSPSVTVLTPQEPGWVNRVVKPYRAHHAQCSTRPSRHKRFLEDPPAADSSR